MALDKDKYRLTHVSGEQLLAYKEGQCGDHEMHEIEKHLLDCELCQEALEGFELFHSKVIRSDLELLQSRIRSRTNSRSEIWKYLGLAASVALLLTVGWFLYPGSDDNLALEKKTEQTSSEKPEPERTEKRSEESLQAEELTQAKEDVINEELSRKVVVKRPRVETKPKPTLPSKAIREESPIDKEQEVILEEESQVEEVMAFESDDAFFDQGAGDEDRILAMESTELESLPMVTSKEPELKDQEQIPAPQSTVSESLQGRAAGVQVTRSSGSPAGKKTKKVRYKSDPMEEIAKQESEIDQNYRANMKATGAVTRASSAGYTIYGKIVDGEDGFEVPGVTILVKNSTIGTVSDIEGRYSLEVPSLNDVLVFSFVGYMTHEVEIIGQQEINVELGLDVESLEEVVVVGYGTSRNYDADYSVPNITQPRPPGGFSTYKKEIRDNLQYPNEAIEDEIEGRVRLKFTVGSSGKVREIEVVKSLGEKCDEEAIRLIQELGDWEPGQRDGINIDMPATYTIRFKLP